MAQDSNLKFYTDIQMEQRTIVNNNQPMINGEVSRYIQWISRGHKRNKPCNLSSTTFSVIAQIPVQLDLPVL